MKGITVEEFYTNLKDKLRLELIAGKAGLKRRIKVAEVNRPGLAFAGYYKYFAYKRIQIVGRAEMSYLKGLSKEGRSKVIKNLFRRNIPCCILARNYRPPKEFIREADVNKVPLFRSPLVTMILLNKATIFLEEYFAPFITTSGDLLEVFGVGVLLKGESGVGKSECALNLVNRGHRLIADDVVRIRVRGGDTLVGSGSLLTRHHMEIRGIGIINVQTLFGAGCIRETKRIDLVVQMEDWDPKKEYERLGLEEKKIHILGIEVPYVVLPVRPGRDIALLVEVACLNQRLKWLGFYSAKDLNEKLIALMKRS